MIGMLRPEMKPHRNILVDGRESAKVTPMMSGLRNLKRKEVLPVTGVANGGPQTRCANSWGLPVERTSVLRFRLLCDVMIKTRGVHRLWAELHRCEITNDWGGKRLRRRA